MGEGFERREPRIVKLETGEREVVRATERVG